MSIGISKPEDATGLEVFEQAAISPLITRIAINESMFLIIYLTVICR